MHRTFLNPDGMHCVAVLPMTRRLGLQAFRQLGDDGAVLLLERVQHHIGRFFQGVGVLALPWLLLLLMQAPAGWQLSVCDGSGLALTPGSAPTSARGLGRRLLPLIFLVSVLAVVHVDGGRRLCPQASSSRFEALRFLEGQEV